MAINRDVVINEKTSMTIKADFKDENGDPVVPDSVIVNLYDEGSRSTIINERAETPASTVYIEITRDNNQIIDDNAVTEYRVLVVNFTYNSTKGATEEFRYGIKNSKYFI